jgi:hypothetical protein
VLDAGDGADPWEGQARITTELRAVVDRVAAAGSTPSPVQHQVTNTMIEVVDFSTAEVRSYFSVLTDAGLDHWGTYRDEVVLDPADATWRFARRTVRVLGWAPASRFARR